MARSIAWRWCWREELLHSASHSGARPFARHSSARTSPYATLLWPLASPQRGMTVVDIGHQGRSMIAQFPGRSPDTTSAHPHEGRARPPPHVGRVRPESNGTYKSPNAHRTHRYGCGQLLPVKKLDSDLARRRSLRRLRCMMALTRVATFKRPLPSKVRKTSSLP